MLYTYKDFGSIPHERGIYAFFLDLDAVIRPVLSGPSTGVRFQRVLDKVIRAHTLCNPEDVGIDLGGRSRGFASRLNVQSSHEICLGSEADTPSEDDLPAFVRALGKCTWAAPPLYVGITKSQTFRTRFSQHRHDYEKLKGRLKASSRGNARRDLFASGGTFAAKMVRRKLEFRHLAFWCTSLSEEELACALHIEKVLHAFINPPFSESH